MLTLIQYNIVPLAICMVIGGLTGLWMFSGRTPVKKDHADDL
jgi:hypothetical protein